VIGDGPAPDVQLVAHPGETFTFERFCEEVDGPAVAVDGLASGPPAWSEEGPHASLNHHEGPPRLFSRATCGQARLAVAHGFWDEMTRDGAPGADVHVNDADPDVCLTVYVLAHPERLDDLVVERLVAAEDIIDTTGAFWCPRWVDDAYLGELAWVFGPYLQARETGLPVDAAGLCALIGEVTGRIGAHADGKGGRSRVWGDFDVKARRGDAVAVVEHGPYARMALRRAGFNVIVAERSSGGIRHITLAKASPFRGPDLVACYQRLNDIDGAAAGDPWGGSDLVGGSPRGRGTTLSLAHILETVAGT